MGGDAAGHATAILKLIHEIQHEIGDVATLVQCGMRYDRTDRWAPASEVQLLRTAAVAPRNTGDDVRFWVWQFAENESRPDW